MTAKGRKPRSRSRSPRWTRHDADPQRGPLRLPGRELPLRPVGPAQPEGGRATGLHRGLGLAGLLDAGEPAGLGLCHHYAQDPNQLAPAACPGLVPDQRRRGQRRARGAPADRHPQGAGHQLHTEHQHTAGGAVRLHQRRGRRPVRGLVRVARRDQHHRSGQRPDRRDGRVGRCAGAFDQDPGSGHDLGRQRNQTADRQRPSSRRQLLCLVRRPARPAAGDALCRTDEPPQSVDLSRGWDQSLHPNPHRYCGSLRRAQQAHRHLAGAGGRHHLELHGHRHQPGQPVQLRQSGAVDRRGPTH